MTINFEFHNDLLFLRASKLSLEKLKDSTDEDDCITYSALVIISCVSLLETFANNLYLFANIDQNEFFSLRLKDKFDILWKSKNKTITHGNKPFQSLTNLINVRNHLVHFKPKDKYLGLIGGDDKWVVDGYNKAPKIDPKKIYNYKTCLNYYTDVKNIMIKTNQALEFNEHENQFIEKEEFRIVSPT